MNQLDETIGWYRIVRANQLLATRVINNFPDVVPDSSPFFRVSSAEAIRQLERSGVEIDDLTILALVSFFEQITLNYLRELAEQVTTEQTEPVLSALSVHAFKNADVGTFGTF